MAFALEASSWVKPLSKSNEDPFSHWHELFNQVSQTYLPGNYPHLESIRGAILATKSLHLEAAPCDVSTAFLKLREVEPYAMSFSLEFFLPRGSLFLSLSFYLSLLAHFLSFLLKEVNPSTRY